VIVATTRNAAAMATSSPSSRATRPTAAAHRIPLPTSIAVTTTFRTWSWKTTLSALRTASGRVAQTNAAAIRMAASSASAKQTPSDRSVTGPISANRSVTRAPTQWAERSGSAAARSTATCARPRLPK
jgi:hypothetical protein